MLTIFNMRGKRNCTQLAAPAQGDIDAGLDLASLLRHPLVENANQIAMTRYLEAQPVLVDVMLAKEAIPAMAEQKRILHSGRRLPGKRCVVR
nr:hypothetical protein [Escherichia coli]